MNIHPQAPHVVIGVDPGLHGGIAIIDCTGVKVHAMPVGGGEIDGAQLSHVFSEAIRCAARVGQPSQTVAAWVEQVGAMPKQGLSSTFKFGKGYGTVLGVLAAMRISTRLVTPQAWKKSILAGTAKDKAAAIAYCARRWPHVSLVLPRCRTPHDGMADAMCIAAYGTL